MKSLIKRAGFKTQFKSQFIIIFLDIFIFWSAFSIERD